MYKEISSLYNALYDELSKRNFINRLCNNLTGDGRYLIQMIAENCEKDVKSFNIAEYYSGIFSGKKIIVWGTSSSGLTRYNFDSYLKTENIYCFCDKDINKQKSTFCGKKVISPNELVTKYTDYYVLIETKYFYDEVYQFLVENHFPEEKIIRHSKNGIQYFDYEYMHLSSNETFIDGGCYDCETLNEFIKAVNGNYSKIISFEPDYANYHKCTKFIQSNKLHNTTVINAALWCKDTTLSFAGDNSVYSKIVDSPNVKGKTIPAVTIDTCCKNENVSFIKMDIEGAELNALKGAEKTIQKHKPKLAICIYHKLEDIIDIEMYLMKIVPQYKFGIRHYTDHAFETVLYAFIPEYTI